jgi:hypothetical protein
MALLRQFYTNFTAGELTPLLSSRLDSDAYKNGAKTLRNFRLRAQGGITRRPGCRYLQTLSNIAYQMESYIYDEDESYILLFSNGQLDIVDTTSLSSVTQTITSCPWITSQIGQIKVAQSGDTMIIVHPDFAMQKLTRTSASNFTLAAYSFDISGNFIHQPYYRFVNPAVTLTPQNSSAGSQNITASTSIFSSDWVGEEIEFTDSDDVVHHIEITSYTSGTVVVGTFDTAPHNTDPRDTWKEQVFSTRHGYARSVTFHDQRLIFGGSRDLPNHMFFSKVGEYFNFDVGSGFDDESIQIQIAENQVSEIKSMESFRHLAVFTSEQELYCPTIENRPLTPSTISVKKQTSFGSGEVNPVEFDGAIVFLTKTKGAIREFIFSDISQAYNSDSITILSQHFIGTPTDICAQREASDQVESYLYSVNTDGNIAIFTSIRKEKLQGWTLYETEGSFKNIVNVNRRVYVICEREINGSTLTTLELLDNQYHLDSAYKDTDATAKTNWQIAHLPNTLVHVKSGNYSLGSYTTDGTGNLTLNAAVTEVEIGINYIPVLTTLPPEFQLQDGISFGQKRRIVRAVLDLNETLDVKAKGTKVIIRRVTSNFANPPDAITARKEIYFLGWSNDGTVTVTQDEPLPIGLNGILLEVEV